MLFFLPNFVGVTVEDDCFDSVGVSFSGEVVVDVCDCVVCVDCVVGVGVVVFSIG